MKKLRLWVHLLFLTAILLVTATFGGTVAAAQSVNQSEIEPAFGQPKMSTARGDHPVVVQVAQPSEWLSGRRNGWNNLTWDMLMWSNFIWERFTLENLTRDIVNWDVSGQQSIVDWVSIVHLD